MVIDKENGISIVLRENASLESFLEEFKQAYPGLRNDNLIINLVSFTNLGARELAPFLKLSDTHRARNKSFVLVTNRVSYDEVPGELNVVPTLQEAKDLIEMDEIERDLEL
jgi:hypothetical protein